jgi:hypothetical protein
MRAPIQTSRSALLAGLAGAVIVLAASVAPAIAKTPPPAAAADGMVECRLPPQVRSLGRNVTYLAAGRQMKLTVAECKQRGGTFEGHGPGAYAGGAADVGNAPLAVTFGGDAKGAACPLQGTVTGLKNGTLAVRNGPGTNFERIDRLANGARVYLCDRAGGGDWVGVVYGSGDCGVSATVDPPRAYDGSCRSGWVRSTYLR